ncbi:MAG: molybdopterin-guanine dinucleotide biosynthesis protein B [Dehalococcoidia bacterium]|jgi:molybdopterin-guanine dinucleotide biosynthesis protein B
MLPVIAIVGNSGSGKTAFIEKLIVELKARGHRLAAVKHAGETVDLDLPGKDTWRFSQAGSPTTIISSPSKITVFKSINHDPSLEETLTSLDENYDLVLAEGFKKSKVLKIEVYGGTDGKDMVCAESDLSAVITDSKLPYKIPKFRPGDIGGIADFIEKEIIGKAPSDIEVTVNGKKIFMKPFVKNIIASSILAMLGSLKTVGIIRSVIISIRNKE